MKLRPSKAVRVWQRNLDVFKQYYMATVIGSIGEPMLFLFGLGLGLGTLVNEINGLGYLEYIAPGVMAVVAMNAAAFECTFGSYTRMVEQNTYDSILATPLEIDDIVLGEIMWGATKSVVSSFSLLMVLTVFGYFNEFAVVPLIMLNMVAIGASISAIALSFSAVSKSYEAFNYFITLFVTPMILFTGVYFPREQIPEPLYSFFYIFPVTHGVNINRFLFHGGDWTMPVIGIFFMPAFTAVAVLVATKLVKRRLIPD